MQGKLQTAEKYMFKKSDTKAGRIILPNPKPTFATAQDEGNTVPSLVLYKHGRCYKGGCDGIPGHGRVVQVALLLVGRAIGVADVLPQHDVVQADGQHGLQHLHLHTYNRGENFSSLTCTNTTEVRT